MNLIKKIIGKDSSLEETLKSKKFKNFSVVKMEQTHDDNFAEVSEKDLEILKKNPQLESKSITIPNVDAIITTKKNILLSVKSADCLPILIHWKNKKRDINDFNDLKIVPCKRQIVTHGEKGKMQLHQPIEKPTELIAAIHSGRAGTEKKILTKVLTHLKNKYGVGKTENKTSSSKLTIWLGPAICEKCYQIDKNTNKHYDLYQKNIDQIWQVFPKSKILKNVLNNNKIIRNKYCTLHDNELFYSYRKTGKGVKMNYSLIGMK